MALNQHADSTEATLVDRGYHWIPVDENTPRGCKLQLINRDAGVAHYHHISAAEGFWTHWAPLPTFGEPRPAEPAPAREPFVMFLMASVLIKTYEAIAWMFLMMLWWTSPVAGIIFAALLVGFLGYTTARTWYRLSRRGTMAETNKE